MAQSASTPPAAPRPTRTTHLDTYEQATAALTAAGAPAETAAQLISGLTEAAWPDAYATFHGVTVTLGADGGFEARPALAGPVCESVEHVGACAHPSCMAVEEPWAEECPRGHGWQHVTDAGSGTGFAGGRIYWTVLECGCTLMDESDDVRAAR